MRGRRSAWRRRGADQDPRCPISNHELPPVHPTEPDGTNPPGLSRAELSRRVVRSVLASSVLGFASLVIGFFGNLVLARLLGPRDFGIVAIGATVILVAGALGDAGLGAGMIRWPRDPTPSELADVEGVQLVITSVLALVVGAIVSSLWSSGVVVAAMLLAMPITSLQSPGRIVLMRGVRYERLSAIDGVATMAFYTWAIATVVAGFGVWGLATATVFRSAIGTVLVWVVGEYGVVPPSLRNVRRLRPLVGFGLRFQAAYLVFVLREVVVSLMTAGIAGVQALGLWSLARRLIEVPFVLVSSLAKVVFPAMAHVLASGREPTPVIERSVRVASVISAIGMATFAGLVPALIPSMFGDNWAEVGRLIPWTTAAIMILAGAGTVCSGFLMAADRSQDALAAVTGGAIVWIVIGAALMPSVGVEAAAVGMLLGVAIEVALYARATHRASGARVLREASIVLVVGGVATILASVLALRSSPTVTTAVLAAAVGFGTSVIGIATFCRSTFVETLAYVRSSVHKVTSSTPPGS